MRRIAVLLAATLLLPPLGCRSAGEQKVQIPPAVEVTQTDAGKTVTLQVGQRVEVALRGNPSTGYQWVPLEGTATGIQQVGEPRFKPDAKLPGAPGMVTLVFRSNQPGRKVLALGYRRPWEKKVPPAKTFSVTLVAK